MRYKTIIIYLLFAILPVPLLANDSIQSYSLKELKVESARGWIEGDKAVFIPTKQEKNLSNDPTSLIKSMHLPIVKEVNGILYGLSGAQITFFINGEKADEIDLATFWSKNVKRIEYIENPANPTFEGAKSVINIIMSNYVAGGITKVDLLQKIPNNGNYSVSSKLCYKKMTFGAMANVGYYRDHRSTNSGNKLYKNLYYDNNFYNQISDEYIENSWERDNFMNFVANAKYSTTKFRTTHTIAFNHDRNPGSGYSSENFWNPDIFNSNQSFNNTTGKSVSTQISGNYYAELSEKWFLSGAWSYSGTHNEKSLYNSIVSEDTIINKCDEHVNSVKMTILPTFIPSEEWLFQFRLTSSLDFFDSKYSGSTNASSKQNRIETTSTAKIWWQPSQRVQISVSPGFAVSYWDIGDSYNECSFQPIANASLNWSPKQKFNIGANLGFYMRTPTANASSDVTIQQSELLWILGNPQLKNLTSWDTYIYSTWLPSANWSASWGMGYVNTRNDFISTYTPASKEKGGIIKTMINAKPTDRVRTNFTLSSNFMDNHLSVSITPQWYFVKFRGGYVTNFNYFTCSGSADYTFKNCKFEIEYDGPFKDVSLSGSEKFWRQDSWNIGAVYGNGNLYIEFKLENIFNNHIKSQTIYDSPNYSSLVNSLQTGRKFSINLAYTFGYGKKVDNNIDISSPIPTKTSVIGL